MTGRTKERAWAKLNLCLDVTGILPGGYHALRSVMQSVSLCDDLTVSVSPGEGNIRVGTNRAYLPTGEKNLAGKAAAVFRDAAGLADMDFAIEIRKHIPVCAGMGGGSSDAAAVLRALNRLCDTGMDTKTLCKLGESIGSDVPYCVLGGTALAEGRGEILTALPNMPECFVVICKPKFPVSTPEMFARIDSAPELLHPDTDRLVDAVKTGDLYGAAASMGNVFETVLPKGQREIASIKGVLRSSGAIGSVMSGSGPTVFGLFPEREGAEAACFVLRQRYRETYFARIPKSWDEME